METAALQGLQQKVLVPQQARLLTLPWVTSTREGCSPSEGRAIAQWKAGRGSSSGGGVGCHRLVDGHLWGGCRWCHRGHRGHHLGGLPQRLRSGHKGLHPVWDYSSRRGLGGSCQQHFHLSHYHRLHMLKTLPRSQLILGTLKSGDLLQLPPHLGNDRLCGTSADAAAHLDQDQPQLPINEFPAPGLDAHKAAQPVLTTAAAQSALNARKN